MTNKEHEYRRTDYIPINKKDLKNVYLHKPTENFKVFTEIMKNKLNKVPHNNNKVKKKKKPLLKKLSLPTLKGKKIKKRRKKLS